MVHSHATVADDRKSEVRKRRILRAAAEEFRARGFHATGMRDIARRAGMTVGNLYYYFKNKDDLLAYCQEDTLVRLHDLSHGVKDRDLEPDARLFLLIAGHVICLNEGVPGSLAHLEIPQGRRGDDKDLGRKRDRYERMLRETISDGVEAGCFRDVDVKVAALAILGAVNWTVRWFRTDGDQAAATIGEAFAEQLVRGLLRPERRFARPSMHELEEHLTPEETP